MAKTPTTPPQNTAQDFLEIFDITNNLVILKNGTVSVALTVSAVNFGLLAEEEQDAVMYAYAGLLNSLNYPIQIVIHSQTKDVTKYLSLLKDQEDAATSAIIRKRIGQYREFVADLIQERNVLDKKFFVVIPATGLELGFVSPKGLLPGQAEINISSYERSVIVEKAKNVLDPRRDHLITQFARIGLYARELETQEVIQLFYVRYNPEAIEGQQIEESASYTAPLVTAQIHQSTYNQLVTSGTNNAPAAPTAISQPPAAPTQDLPDIAQLADQQLTITTPLSPTPEPELASQPKADSPPPIVTSQTETITPPETRLPSDAPSQADSHFQPELETESLPMPAQL